ncbi:DEAD/DEAH box helicase [Salisediminibacterium selenitireducens]|uniref:ATP-dependent RNA helicase CshA n=1 Tax=Bacillus selenitireducens (strain ATCC 700615 / DSM 15326 / MLS10) TaxID=439292 RepID=D6XU31_BACIE|nr:DEAD/DEAH box helicase [Salisediminibacterium selenitireducens]ADH99317.1 DEAD/DEAH box helicase domain protein [[Bacillus] selenitireducens MLS10]
MMTFEEFNISKSLMRAIKEMGFEAPSPIQEKVIPTILEGNDLIGQAQTGTGKTAAFGIPILEKLKRTKNVQAIILTPTRELAIQVAGEIQKLSKFQKVQTLPVYGGQSIGQQIKQLKRGVDIVVGTPGRVLDHVNRKTLDLSKIHTFVLDEADEMLDMGFIEDIEKIIQVSSEERQTLLFSATMPPPIRKLSNKYMNSPEQVTISKSEVTAPSINQVYYKVLEKNKLDSLCRLIDSENTDLGIIFCRTKKGVSELAEALQARGYRADGLHGDLTQSQRDSVMKKFRDSSIDFLIATDVAARGIDVQNVTHVVNYDIPQDPESYVHRIGRTGRAGREGIALTLVTPREMKHLRSIENEIKMKIPSQNLPSVEEVIEKQQDVWKSQVIDMIENDDEGVSHYDAIVTDLLDHYQPEKVVTALMKLAFYSHDEKISKETYNFGETGAQKGMTRFFINVGRNVDMTPKKLVDEVAKLVGISPKAIGKIDIFENFTFIEVPEEVAPFVYEGLKYQRVSGAKINLEPAKPRPKRK